MNNEIIKLLGKVPELPKATLHIESVYKNPESSIADLADAIVQCPITTAFIMKIANSPYYGFARSVTDISHAVSLFGKDTVRSFAIASATNNIILADLSPYGISTSTYSKRARIQNALVTRWVSKIDRGLLRCLSLASFLLELGMIVISEFVIMNRKIVAFKEALRSEPTLREAEIKICGISHEKVTAMMFEKWGFEKELVELLNNSIKPETAPNSEIARMSKYLQIAKTAITLDASITKETLEEAYKLLDSHELAREPFDDAVSAMLQVA